MRRLAGLTLAVLTMTATLLAADVDGRWTGTVSTPNGDVPVGFTFKADGTALTGTMQGIDGSDIPIKDGKVDGQNISFNVSLDFGGMPIELAYKGVVTPAEIKFTAEFAGMPFEFVVKKAS